MIKKIIIAVISIITLITACKKTSSSNVDPRITAYYMFKPGTYWIYSDGNGNTDSQYVAATGTQNGFPYMQIHETLNGANRATIYIGAGPKSNQMQLWGYGYNGGNATQVIFEVDTPNLGATIAQACTFDGVNYGTPDVATIPGTQLNYTVTYSLSNKNQEYSDVDYYFDPNQGIVMRTEYATPLGDLFWYLVSQHIVQ
jgi:hypothetical protein